MPEQFCTFTVDDLFFGVPVAQVQEVVRHQTLTPVPLAPPEVRGLINLRGQIVTAIDLRRRLRLPPAPPERAPMNILLKRHDSAVSLVVDTIEDVLPISDDTIEPPPETVEAPARALIRGASKQRDRLMLLLDTDKALELSPG